MGFSSLYFAVQLEAKMNKHSAYAQSLGHKTISLAAMLQSGNKCSSKNSLTSALRVSSLTLLKSSQPFEPRNV